MGNDEAVPRDVVAGLVELRQLNQQHGQLEGERARLAQERGMHAVDLYLVDGVPAETLVGQVEGVTRQGVLKWMRQHGSKTYVMVRRKGHGFEVATLPLPVGSDDMILLKESRRLVSEHREGGWRFAPSRWGLRADTLDPAELWHRLTS